MSDEPAKSDGGEDRVINLSEATYKSLNLAPNSGQPQNPFEPATPAADAGPAASSADSSGSGDSQGEG